MADVHDDDPCIPRSVFEKVLTEYDPTREDRAIVINAIRQLISSCRKSPAPPPMSTTTGAVIGVVTTGPGGRGGGSGGGATAASAAAQFGARAHHHHHHQQQHQHAGNNNSNHHHANNNHHHHHHNHHHAARTSSGLLHPGPASHSRTPNCWRLSTTATVTDNLEGGGEGAFIIGGGSNSSSSRNTTGGKKQRPPPPPPRPHDVVDRSSSSSSSIQQYLQSQHNPPPSQSGGCRTSKLSSTKTSKKSDLVGCLNKINASNYQRIRCRVLEMSRTRLSYVIETILDNCVMQPFFGDTYLRLLGDVYASTGGVESRAREDARSQIDRLVGRVVASLTTTTTAAATDVVNPTTSTTSTPTPTPTPTPTLPSGDGEGTPDEDEKDAVVVKIHHDDSSTRLAAHLTLVKILGWGERKWYRKAEDRRCEQQAHLCCDTLLSALCRLGDDTVDCRETSSFNDGSTMTNTITTCRFLLRCLSHHASQDRMFQTHREHLAFVNDCTAAADRIVDICADNQSRFLLIEIRERMGGSSGGNGRV